MTGGRARRAACVRGEPQGPRCSGKLARGTRRRHLVSGQSGRDAAAVSGAAFAAARGVGARAARGDASPKPDGWVAPSAPGLSALCLGFRELECRRLASIAKPRC